MNNLNDFKVASINTRLVGGAFNVVANLQQSFHENNSIYDIFYGYGKRGLRDPSESNVGASRLVSFPVPLLNYFGHAITGIDLFSQGKIQARKLVSLFSAYDVIHLNVIHSHISSLKWIVDLLVSVNKPIIWTHHDSWAVTGRCAITSGCIGFQTGCHPCLNLKAYPMSKLDFAGNHFQSKRELLGDLNDRTILINVAPSKWIGDQIREQLGFKVRIIHNSVSTEFFDYQPRNIQKKNVVFSCRDLRDSIKTQGDQLYKIARELKGHLTIIGNFPSAELIGTGAIILPFIEDRSSYIEEISQYNTLIFLSTSDSFSLTAVEARILGLRVILFECAVASELRLISGVEVASNTIDLIRMIENKNRGTTFDRDYFRVERMKNEYFKLMREIGTLTK
jgi:putative colanic acid biosynthesis glycosyltransferase